MNVAVFWDIAQCSLYVNPDISEERITSIFRVENYPRRKPASSWLGLCWVVEYGIVWNKNWKDETQALGGAWPTTASLFTTNRRGLQTALELNLDICDWKSVHNRFTYNATPKD
jgi:hypothetical protein